MDPNILSALAEFQPESLLECSLAPWPELDDFCRTHKIPLYRLAPSEIAEASLTADLAIVHNTLESVGTRPGQQILGYLRNSLAKRIWVLVSKDSDWPLQDFIGLGFRRDASLLSDTSYLHSYTYDIRSYNHKRNWNNPRFWANPENFHKYRW